MPSLFISLSLFFICLLLGSLAYFSVYYSELEKVYCKVVSCNYSISYKPFMPVLLLTYRGIYSLLGYIQGIYLTLN